MKNFLEFRAGESAFAHIRANGLSADDVKVVAGASGAAKWLVLGGLDRYLFSSWFKSRKNPLFLVGSSIGAWRFASVACPDPGRALDILEDGYIQQRYKGRPKPKDISIFGWDLLGRLLDADAVDYIANHPFMRLNILTVRSRGPLATESGFQTGVGLIAAALANSVSRKCLGLFFERALFSDFRDKPDFFGMDQFPIKQIPIDSKNIKAAVMASGSIPVAMEPVRDISGAPSGFYRDGGVIDYHLDIPFLHPESDGITLYPHYSDSVIPGWFDKPFKSRRPDKKHMSSVLMLSPSAEFIKRLPYRKIPDRSDFINFMNRDRERISYWTKAVEMSRIFADEFHNAVESGRIRNLIMPM